MRWSKKRLSGPTIPSSRTITFEGWVSNQGRWAWWRSSGGLVGCQVVVGFEFGAGGVEGFGGERLGVDLSEPVDEGAPGLVYLRG